jgi:hypothetical protein
VPWFAVHYRARCLLQFQRIQWFDDPTFGSTTAGKMHIGLAVEEHDHGYVWDAVVAVI